jgi:hypothetical protein
MPPWAAPESPGRPGAGHRAGVKGAASFGPFSQTVLDLFGRPVARALRRWALIGLTGLVGSRVAAQRVSRSQRGKTCLPNDCLDHGSRREDGE